MTSGYLRYARTEECERPGERAEKAGVDNTPKALTNTGVSSEDGHRSAQLMH